MWPKASIAIISLLVNVAIAGECNPDDYNSYIQIVNEERNCANKLRILEAVISQTILEYPRDWDTFSTIYDQLKQLRENDIAECNDKTRSPERLRDRISKYYIAQIAPTVAQILKNDRYPNKDELKYLLTLCSTQGLQEENISEVFEAAVDECLKSNVAPHVLAAQLNHLSTKLSMHVLWNAQIHLYWAWKANDYNNDQYIFDLAYYTSQANVLPNYKELNSTARKYIEQIIYELPSSLLYLFHKPEYCLLNKEYEEFIYTTNRVGIDENNIYIFTWTDKYHVADNGPWLHNITQLDFVDTPNLQLIFNLRSRLLNKYMFRTDIAGRTNLIVSRDDHTLPDNSDFIFKFLNTSNAFVIKQDGKLVCSSPQLYNRSRRFVYAYDDHEHTPSTKACQWIARECPYSH